MQSGCACGSSADLSQGLRAALDRTSIGICVFDDRHEPVWMNDAIMTLVDPSDSFEPEVSSTLDDWISFDAGGRRFDFEGMIDRCLGAGDHIPAQLLGFRRPDGSIFWAETEAVPIPACGCGAERYAAVISTDLTERRFQEDALRRLAFSDPLTGLANRALLEDRLERVVAPRRSGAGSSTLFYLDLDGFKPVNDRFGHEVGDRVLCVVADRLTSQFDSGDTVARIGGDEFAVLAEGIADGEELAERARLLVQAPMGIDADATRPPLSVGVSIGFVTAGPAASGEAILSRADRAMYADKVSRRRGPTRH